MEEVRQGDGGSVRAVCHAGVLRHRLRHADQRHRGGHRDQPAHRHSAHRHRHRVRHRHRYHHPRRHRNYRDRVRKAGSGHGAVLCARLHRHPRHQLRLHSPGVQGNLHPCVPAGRGRGRSGRRRHPSRAPVRRGARSVLERVRHGLRAARCIRRADAQSGASGARLRDRHVLDDGRCLPYDRVSCSSRLS